MLFFFVKHKTAYEMRMSDWSSDVCSSDLMPLPEDEKTWDRYNVMFSTAVGNVRRNLLSDFVNIKANGKIAMKLDEGDTLVNVNTCTEADDVLIAPRGGMCIRFPVPDVRSEEHTSEIQSLMRSSYAVFCLKQTTLT